MMARRVRLLDYSSGAAGRPVGMVCCASPMLMVVCCLLCGLYVAVAVMKGGVVRSVT